MVHFNLDFDLLILLYYLYLIKDLKGCYNFYLYIYIYIYIYVLKKGNEVGIEGIYK